VELSTTIRLALEKDPAKRPPTALAFARLVKVSAASSGRQEPPEAG
jgi:hypothetical protein